MFGDVVVIGREFGSGGREVGIKLAEKLGIPFYDKEIITMTAEEGELNPDFVANNEEKAPVFSVGGIGRMSFMSFSYQPTFSDTIYIKQSDVIKKMAEKPCIIVGRCAEYVLRDNPDAVKVFITAGMPCKIQRKRAMAPEKAGYSDEQMEKYLNSVDKQRRKYFEHYTDYKWGDLKNYDLCISTDRIGCDGAVELILNYINQTK